MDAAWVAITMWWRLYRSAMAPPTVEKRKTGIRLANREPEQEGGTRETVDQPALRHGLHPGADQRNELPADEQPVVPVS